MDWPYKYIKRGKTKVRKDGNDTLFMVREYGNYWQPGTYADICIVSPLSLHFPNRLNSRLKRLRANQILKEYNAPYSFRGLHGRVKLVHHINPANVGRRKTKTVRWHTGETIIRLDDFEQTQP